jgi:hypothetical protein
MFKTIAPVAGKIFNAIHNELPEVVAPRLVPDTDGGFTEINESKGLLVSALNLILVNGGTQDNWLFDSLRTNCPEIDFSLKAIQGINRFLIKQGVIERHPVEEEIYNTRKRKMERKEIWKLTTDWQLAIAEAMDKPVISFKPLAIGEELPFAVNRVKGKSEYTDAATAGAALEKMDEVKLKYSRISEELFRIRKQLIRDMDVSTKEGANKKDKAVDELLLMAKEVRERGEKPFTLVHTNDFRLRTYARGGFVSTQAGKLHKGLIRFAEAYPIDQEEIDIFVAGLKPKDAVEKAATLAEPGHAILRVDGKCNGIQWMSAFTNHPLGMKLTCLTGTSDNDLYSFFGSLAKMSRDDAKSVIMPYGYGAELKTAIKKVPHVPARTVTKLIETLDNQLPLKKLLDHLKMEAGLSTRKEFSWVMPDGAKVVQDYEIAETITGGSFSITVDGTQERDNRRMISALLPNIIHSIDGYFTRQVVLTCNFPVVTIHDSFGCHSCNVKTLRKVINHEFRKIIEMDLLNNIFDQLGFDRYVDPCDPSVITNPNMFK